MARIDPRKLSKRQAEERNRAAHAKNLMQRDGLRLRPAARIAKVRPNAILEWFPDSVVRDASGRYVARHDKEIFVMGFVAKGHGYVERNVRGSAQRQLVGRHWAAINSALDPRDGREGPLLALRGQTVAGLELETDINEIEELYFAGMLDFVVVYVVDL